MFRSLALACAASLLAGLVGCATVHDPFRDQPTRVAYEVGEQVALARPQFQTLWNWYLSTIDPRAPYTEIEVCLTIAPDGRVIDSYIDAATIRHKALIEGVLGIYNRMQFPPREVPEITLCDDPLQFLPAIAEPESEAAPGQEDAAEPAPAAAVELPAEDAPEPLRP